MRWILLFLFATFTYATPSFLLPKEVEWLTNNPAPFRIAITQIPNQVLKTPNGYKGFSIELFEHLQKLIEHPFTFVYYPTWKEALKAAKNREVDILFLAQKTPSRLAYLDFTDTVLTQHNHLIVPIDSSLKKLENAKKIALVQGSALEEYIRSYYPSITIIKTANELESLLCVKKGACEATISEPVRASAYMQKANINGLVVSSDIGYNYYLAIATIDTKPQLNVILTKALHAMDPKELQALKLKWGYLQKEMDYRTLFLTTLTGVAFAILALYLFILNRRLKEALSNVKKLQHEKSTIMEKTISTLAHHWRQPLNTLSMLVDLLAMRYQQNKLDADFIKSFNEKAKSYINHLSDSLELFRSFKLTESKSDCDLVAIAKKCITEFGKKNPSVHFGLEAPDTLRLQSYPHNLKKLLSILLQNSIDATQDQQSASITLRIESKTDEVILQILDNGKGVNEEIAQQIFDPYFSTKTEKNDVGLGLYLAKLIVTNYLHGTIRFVSNNPTTFEVRFPKESK